MKKNSSHLPEAAPLTQRRGIKKSAVTWQRDWDTIMLNTRLSKSGGEEARIRSDSE